MAKPREDRHNKKGPLGDTRRQRMMMRLLILCCAVVLAADLVVHRHVVDPLESLFGFYAFFAFLSCVVLVLLAKEVRKVLMRREDYHDSVDD